MGEHLTALDATFLELEQVDRSAHMHIGGVMIFEPPPEGGPPSLDRVREEFLARLPDLPRWSQRLSTPHTSGLRWPTWEDDEAFEIENHVFAARIPDPRGEEELLEWAAEYYSQRLDRTRPLWEVAVCALSEGRWAMTTKTHHCMVDGVGSVDLAQTLLDAEASAEPRRSRQAPGASETPRSPRASDAKLAISTPSPVSGALDLAAGIGGAGLRLVQGGARAIRGALRLGVGAAVHPERAREALTRARAIAGLLYRDELIAAPRTTLNRPIGPNRRLAVVEVPLGDLKLVKRALGGTVNDVVLAAAAGGLRRLLVDRGEELPAQGLRAMVPVNIRAAGDQLAAGNKITSLFVHLPIAEPDPKARYVQQVDEAETLKAGTQAIGSSTLLEITSLAPPVLHSVLARSLYATRLFNVTITNVPGPQQPLYAFGSRMRGAWPLVPLAAEHAIAVAVFSYDGKVFLCLNADRESVPDLEVAANGIERSLRELSELARSREAGRGTPDPEAARP